MGFLFKNWVGQKKKHNKEEGKRVRKPSQKTSSRRKNRVQKREKGEHLFGPRWGRIQHPFQQKKEEPKKRATKRRVNAKKVRQRKRLLLQPPVPGTILCNESNGKLGKEK